MPTYNKYEMTVGELQATNALYDMNSAFWEFMLASYEGIQALLAGGFCIERHERESTDNYNRRVSEAYGFCYSSSIVDIFNFYLFKKTPGRDMGPLTNDKQWAMFENDCDLYGNPFESWLLETQRYASIMGHVGVLVDKSGTKYETKDEEIKRKVYPYTARYFPQNILDWEFKRDDDNRPYLAYLKLLDDDGTYRIWTTEWWATYVIEDDSTTTITAADVDTGTVRGGATDEENKVTPQSNGDNPFVNAETGMGEIPFVWFMNIRSKTIPIGVSDIKDVAYIDSSIIRNCSEGEEVITYAAFPMMRKPMREAGAGAQGRGADDDVGVTAILEFDPDLPNSKPDWLEAVVAEPIDAILKWIELKVSEIYRATNVGGMAATEIQTAPKSGTALKSEFQLLNGKLVSKGMNCEKAELAIKKYWGMWQMYSAEDMAKVTVEWPESYDMENLTQDLENALTSKALVQSKTFVTAVQKQIARTMLPNADNKMLKEIDKEIEDNTKTTSKLPGDNVKDSDRIDKGDKSTPLVPIPGGKDIVPAKKPEGSQSAPGTAVEGE